MTELDSEIRALVVYLNTVMCMPYNRVKSFLHDVMCVDISEGSIRNFIEDAGNKADKICDRIARNLSKALWQSRMNRDFNNYHLVFFLLKKVNQLFCFCRLRENFIILQIIKDGF